MKNFGKEDDVDERNIDEKKGYKRGRRIWEIKCWKREGEGNVVSERGLSEKDKGDERGKGRGREKEERGRRKNILGMEGVKR